jgi:hypothetical protein
LKEHLALADVNPVRIKGRLIEVQANRRFTQVTSLPEVMHSGRSVARRDLEAETPLLG